MTTSLLLAAKNKSASEYESTEDKCPMVQFVELIAGKWAIPILYRLIVTAAPIRFGDLQRAIAPITQKELTRQLRAFEKRGLVNRKVYAQVPPRVEYEITPLGKTLQPTLDSLAQWMTAHHKDLN
ncbi:winged helix-turn-helix transcriptional regulator [Yersinia massiliensis]|uniref:winged helix-turn-helix transcriptional regulator n=1 Tax=Yersinia massiliensis TaxID=419257 RepID=UPI0002E6D316